MEVSMSDEKGGKNFFDDENDLDFYDEFNPKRKDAEPEPENIIRITKVRGKCLVEKQ